MAAGKIHRKRAPGSMASAMVAWSLLSLLPDADVAGFAFGLRYAAPWGHRGATHSLLFAVLAGVAFGALASFYGAPRRRTMLLAVAVVASHPLLDTLTTGGLGCALFWPFSNHRYFAPWRPIPVAPLGAAFLSARGLRVALVEVVMFFPIWAYALVPRSTHNRV